MDNTSLTERKPAVAKKPDRIALAMRKGLSDRSAISSSVFFSSLRPTSKIKYDREMELWDEYLELFPGSDPRDLQTIKHYAEVMWLIARANPKAKAAPETIRVQM
ncbi:hypothetical protein SEPCBS119000_003787 [Sporothrix epigloea]|uniref:Uncharacterized protein n=1 Tax=Sporothrix epigloea TaxID=1892477 RepID=A0ABP0DQL7_9PEZI